MTPSLCDALSCFICSAPYTSERRPTNLSCGHTYCDKCIKNWTQASKDQNCPECRAKIVSKTINYAMEDLIEAMAANPQESSPSSLPNVKPAPSLTENKRRREEQEKADLLFARKVARQEPKYNSDELPPSSSSSSCEVLTIENEEERQLEEFSSSLNQFLGYSELLRMKLYLSTSVRENWNNIMSNPSCCFRNILISLCESGELYMFINALHKVHCPRLVDFIEDSTVGYMFKLGAPPYKISGLSSSPCSLSSSSSCEVSTIENEDERQLEELSSSFNQLLTIRDLEKMKPFLSTSVQKNWVNIMSNPTLRVREILIDLNKSDELYLFVEALKRIEYVALIDCIERSPAGAMFVRR